MKYISLILVLIGAVLAYGAKKIADKLIAEKRDVTENDIIKIKLLGLGFVLIAAVITFLF
ncbi:MAG: hypothetical protein E7395_06900 [Ruminococcaceae bacterium]|nr:hypothetical protein [Oscillospiraceae bacterium]